MHTQLEKQKRAIFFPLNHGLSKLPRQNLATHHQLHIAKTIFGRRIQNQLEWQKHANFFSLNHGLSKFGHQSTHRKLHIPKFAINKDKYFKSTRKRVQILDLLLKQYGWNPRNQLSNEPGSFDCHFGNILWHTVPQLAVDIFTCGCHILLSCAS